MRAAVIGAGAMGINHLRVYSQVHGVELVGVADTSPDAVEAAGRRYHIPAHLNHLALLDRERPDVVSVAVPTRQHTQVAVDCAKRGVHVLVEKPIAATEAEAAAIIEAAASAGVKLAVGHVERFNPAVIELKRRLDGGALGRVFMMHSRRLSPYPGRAMDVGVGKDLATHELDIMCYLIGTKPVRAYGETNRVLHPVHEDILFGVLRFPSGILGIIDVNWVTPTKTRELTITGEEGSFVVNYLTQELYFYKNAYSEHIQGEPTWPGAQPFTVIEGDMTRIRIERREPLLSEIEDFLLSVREDRDPAVTGSDGLVALALVEQLLDSGNLPRFGVVNEALI